MEYKSNFAHVTCINSFKELSQLTKMVSLFSFSYLFRKLLSGHCEHYYD